MSNLQSISGITGTAWTVSMVITLVVGALICFAGYRLIRVTMVLMSLFLGFLMGSFLFSDWLDSSPRFIILGLSLLLGVVLAVTSGMFLKLGIFLTCLFGGATVCYAFFMVFTIPAIQEYEWIIGVAVGLVIAILSLIRNREIIIVITAWGGASMIAQLGVKYLVLKTMVGASVISWVLMLLFFFLGLLVQFKGTAKGHHHQKKRDKKS